MPRDSTALLDAITTLVERLPGGAIVPLTTAMATIPAGAWAALQRAAQHVLATPYYREQVEAFLLAWRMDAPEIPPASVALALRAAAHTRVEQQRTQTLELVWTGPASVQPLRRTAQVLGELIDAARRDLLIVAFAVYDIPEIGQALLRAAERGVHLRLVIESPRESSGRLAYDGLAAFGAQVTQHATIYRWPAEQRPKDADGRPGSLHAKCAVADEQVLLISSANLTYYALHLNVELGVLVRGGPLPQQTSHHFHDLIQRGTLVEARP